MPIRRWRWLLGRTPGAKKPDPDVEKFVVRASRGGVDRDTLVGMIDQHLAEELGFATFQDRMRFVERLAVHKMAQEGKLHWGVKIASNYDELAELYPDAHFLFMLRDGRDVAASRKNVGEFNKTVTAIAESWCAQVESFRQFAARYGQRAQMVRYEELTSR